MKITHSQLRKIIRENVRLLTEDSFTRVATTGDQEKSLRKLKQWLPKLGFRYFHSLRMPETSPPTTVLVDLTYQGGELYIETDGEITVRGASTPVDNISDLRLELEMAGISPRRSTNENYSGIRVARLRGQQQHLVRELEQPHI